MDPPSSKRILLENESILFDVEDEQAKRESKDYSISTKCNDFGNGYRIGQ
jgi:hypothetical protein